jgi:hypothetical protein
VNLALLLSAAGVLLCLVLVVRSRRGSAITVPRPVPIVARQPAPPRWGAVVGVALLAAVVVSPIAAVIGAAVVVLSRRWPWVGRVLPVLVIAGAMAVITVLQVGHGYPASFIWPTRFPWAHQATLLAVVVLLGTALPPDEPDPRR